MNPLILFLLVSVITLTLLIRGLPIIKAIYFLVKSQRNLQRIVKKSKSKVEGKLTEELFWRLRNRGVKFFYFRKAVYMVWPNEHIYRDRFILWDHDSPKFLFGLELRSIL